MFSSALWASIAQVCIFTSPSTRSPRATPSHAPFERGGGGGGTRSTCLFKTPRRQQNRQKRFFFWRVLDSHAASRSVTQRHINSVTQNTHVIVAATRRSSEVAANARAKKHSFRCAMFRCALRVSRVCLVARVTRRTTKSFVCAPSMSHRAPGVAVTSSPRVVFALRSFASSSSSTASEAIGCDV